MLVAPVGTRKMGVSEYFPALASSEELQPEEIERLEDHEFPRLEWLYWRNAEPDLTSVTSLIQSLEDKPKDRFYKLRRKRLIWRCSKDSHKIRMVNRQLAIGHEQVRLLWEAACIPDFRKIGADHQARFVASLWPYLAQGNGRIPHARMAQEISRLENVQGDISTLAARISAARSWSYIAQKSRWVEQADVMVERTSCTGAAAKRCHAYSVDPKICR